MEDHRSDELDQQVDAIVQNLNHRLSEVHRGTVNESDADQEENKIFIHKKHILSALSQTMPSLNENERAKYEYIYEEFMNPTPASERRFEQRVTLA
ncbi:hypothetical protein D3C80_1861910 [compost metagenome]